jgi:hypothetical protein
MDTYLLIALPFLVIAALVLILFYRLEENE